MTSPISIPTSIADIDNGSILGFGPDLAPDHPGFGDSAYAARRSAIAAAARGHVAGTPPPGCAYTAEETAVWGEVLTQLTALAPASACREYLAALPGLGFTPSTIPQLATVDAALSKASGWSIRPVAGLMHPRDFLAGLAFRTFHSTQYVRHPSRPNYTPEPDVVSGDEEKREREGDERAFFQPPLTHAAPLSLSRPSPPLVS